MPSILTQTQVLLNPKTQEESEQIFETQDNGVLSESEMDDDNVDEEESEYELDLSEEYESEEEEEEEDDNEDCAQRPFWFSHEDSDHIRAILECYTKELSADLNNDTRRKNSSKSLFIGAVKRAEVRNKGDFMTLDEVRIYTRVALPDGCPLPFAKQVHLLTSWNDEGLPKSFSHLDSTMKAFWAGRIQSVSFLYYFPVRSTDDALFLVNQEDLCVCYQSRSSHTPCYEPFLADFRTHHPGLQEGLMTDDCGNLIETCTFTH